MADTTSAEVLHEFDHYLDDPDDRHVDDDLVAAEGPLSSESLLSYARTSVNKVDMNL